MKKEKKSKKGQKKRCSKCHEAGHNIRRHKGR